MKFAVVLLCLFAGAAVASSDPGPVKKVVNLLKDLKKKIEGDGDQESQVFNKYACWCTNTINRKAEDIHAGRDNLRSLGQTILKTKGEVAVLSSEIEQLGSDIKNNQQEQADATNIRMKANTNYQAASSEMKQSLAALEQATIVLRDGTALLQGGSVSAAAAKAMQHLVQVLPDSVLLKPEQMSLMAEFSAGRYAPQSATIQGILRDMYMTFAGDLEDSTMTEATQNKDFENLIAVKSEELATMQKTVAKKTGQKADAEQALADANQDYDDTTKQLAADKEFFDASKAACTDKAQAWKLRTSLRAEELAGVTKALEILSSDEARELFSSAIKPGKETGADAAVDTGVDISSFLQVELHSKIAAPNVRAYETLKAKAAESHSLRLAQLAVQVREAKAGHFDQVITAIDEMIATLASEGKADMDKRDQCKSEYTSIASKIGDVTWLIQKNVAKIDKLQNSIDKREAEKAETIEGIETVVAEIAQMQAEREAGNAAFLHAKTEDQDAIALLLSAKTALSSYFSNNTIDMGPLQLVQKKQEPEFAISQDQAPDAIFKDKDSNAGQSKGIVSILTMIIEDLNDEIANSITAEASAQTAYETQRATAEKLQADLEAKKVNLEEMIATLQEEKTDEETLKGENEEDLKDEETYKAEIKPDCDWIIGSFEKRAASRTAEHNGLTAAKEFLVGYVPAGSAALLEQKDLSKIRFLGMSN
jgi:hypothetical protein